MKSVLTVDCLHRQVPYNVADSVALLPLISMGPLGCSGAISTASSGPVGTPAAQVAMPSFNLSPAQNGAVVLGISDITQNARICYTADGSMPTATSAQYLAPFLMTTSASIKAIALLAGDMTSVVTTQAVTANIASGMLVWSDGFSNSTSSNAQPNPAVWGYDAGASGWGNAELEDYCAWASTTSPCSAANPNAYVGTDGYLHIVAQQPSAGVYTSARLKTLGLFSFQYGRLEFRVQVPEAQGFWPTAWMLGNNFATSGWPACGEMDVMERVNVATSLDFNVGSIHGPGFTGKPIGTNYNFPNGVTASTWHTYRVIWKPGSVAYYVDDPIKPYMTYTPKSLAGLSVASWPFDEGQANFIILNLAVGGLYPGASAAATSFPSQVPVDYVRLYTN
jgi:beta-glucanase (GH16 family)